MAKTIISEYPQTFATRNSLEMNELMMSRDSNFSYQNSVDNRKTYTVDKKPVRVITKGSLAKEKKEGHYTIELENINLISFDNFVDLNSPIQLIKVEEIEEVLGVYNVQARLDNYFNKGIDARDYIDPLNNPSYDKFIPGFRKKIRNSILKIGMNFPPNYVLLGPSTGEILQETETSKLSNENNLEGYISLSYALLK